MVGGCTLSPQEVIGSCMLVPGGQDDAMLSSGEVEMVEDCISSGDVDKFCTCLQNLIPSSLALISSFSSFVACLLVNACQYNLHSCLSILHAVHLCPYLSFACRCMSILTLVHCLCACVLVSLWWHEISAVPHSSFQVLQPRLPNTERLRHSWPTLL